MSDFIKTFVASFLGFMLGLMFVVNSDVTYIVSKSPEGVLITEKDGVIYRLVKVEIPK